MASFLLLKQKQMPNTPALAPAAPTPAEAKRRFEAMSANPLRHTAADWTAIAELLEDLAHAEAQRAGGAGTGQFFALADRAAECRHRAQRIAILRRTFSGVVGAGFRGGEAA